MSFTRPSPFLAHRLENVTSFYYTGWLLLVSAFLRTKAVCYDSKKEPRKSALRAADFRVGLAARAGWVRGLT